MKQSIIFIVKTLAICLCLSALISSCRKDDIILPPVITQVEPPDSTEMIDSISGMKLLGFYLLNEGNMGSNMSTLDYFDIFTGNYHRNIYGAANPSVPKELGDVGNHLGIYGSKLYAVINCSNKVEVMDKQTVRRIGQINIPNCRYIKFHGGYAYVTSYAGPVDINPNYKQIGYVAKVDTATLQIVAKCLVGFQPDELEIVEDKIYVANSGGYIVPNYENTVSVIDIHSFTEVKRIEVAINLQYLRADAYGNLWVTSRGDYFNVPSQLYWVDTKTDTYGGKLDIPVSNFWLDGDSLYIISNQWSYLNYENTATYGIVDVSKKQIVSNNFIADGEEKKIAMPYGIMVNPYNKDIYITDAVNYVYPGVLFCFDKFGKKKWDEQTGNIPAHFALNYIEI